MNGYLLRRLLAGALGLGLAAGCAAADARLVGTVVAVMPGTGTLVVGTPAGGQTAVSVTDDTHFWSGTTLEQIRTGDRVSIRVTREDDRVVARSIEIFPAGRPRTRFIGPGGY